MSQTSDLTDIRPNGRRVLLAGATGLIGGELLRGLLADDTVGMVHVLTRRPLAATHPKLRAQVVDFAALPSLPPLDEAYLALGAGARRLGLVSAMGASPRSRVFYNQVKGELEEAIKALGFDGLVIARPSLLLGDRGALGQQARPGEYVGSLLAGMLSPFIPARYQPIQGADVAYALLFHLPSAHGKVVLSSDAMQGRE